MSVATVNVPPEAANSLVGFENTLVKVNEGTGVSTSNARISS